MRFADMVLARELLTRLDERQIDIILDALEGQPVEVNVRDRAAIDAFVRAIHHELGPAPAATEVEAVRSFVHQKTSWTGDQSRR